MFVNTFTFSALVANALADSAGFVLPSSGLASTTKFYLGPELSSGTVCGMNALPNSASTSRKQGGGPGYLYVRLFLKSYISGIKQFSEKFETGSNQPARFRRQLICHRCWWTR
jgi:hypothetical protein